MTKRALSLDDLVNHDEGDRSKLQKMGEENTQPVKVQQEFPVAQPIMAPKRHSNVSDILNNDDDDEDQFKPERSISSASVSTSTGSRPDGSVAAVSFNIEKDNSQPVKPNLHNDSDATDTDDEVGGKGEINFDSGMTFDYDKQDRNSPQKIKPEAKPKVTKPKVELQEELKAEEKIAEGIKKEEQNDGKIDMKEEDSVEPNSDNTISEVNNIFEEKSSSESKRNNVKKDLQVLNEIAATSKPNKYKNVPIWAQKWKPTVNALQNIDSGDFKIDSSFLGIIPDDDLTKSVQDWVYATIYSIAPDLRQFIELEMKFGIIRDDKGPDRVSPPISSQAVFTEMDAHLTPNIDGVLFKELSKYIHGIGELTENVGKFNVIESLTKDSVYRVGLSTQRPRFLRMSTDVKTGRVGQFIEKRHISQILLYSPKDSYDIKISLNLELPVPENDPPEKYQSQTPISERTKDRVSYIHNDSCTRIDITKVQTHNQGVKGKHTEVTHEIELEINTPALIKSFDNITSDSKEYASLIRTFLNNGTIIRRKLSSLSYEIFEGTKK